MPKRPAQSEADRLWKEKLTPSATLEEGIVLLILLIAVGAFVLVAGL